VTTTTPSRPQNAPWNVALGGVIAAFGTYFCMYGFRKPFTVATYSDVAPFWGIDFKVLLIVVQVIGYTLSKFVGVWYIGEVQPHRRIPSLLLQIGSAEIALLLFAVTPAPFNAIWLFFNGLMLGMIFGLVLGFLEGRRHTEALIAALCTSFILADGAVKSVGSWLMSQGVPELWMPFTAGMLFVLPLVICCSILKRMPPPDARDVAARSERSTMAAADRRRFLKRYGFGLAPIVLMYLLVTILRSVRADFAPEIWAGLGVTVDPGIFTRSEAFVALGVLVLNGSMILIKNNRSAFFVAVGLACLGLVLTGTAVEGLKNTLISPFMFMVFLGLGLYLPYIAVHTTIFERFIAMTRDRGTIGYLMYVADAIGYLGYVAVLLARQLIDCESSDGLLSAFLTLCTVVALVGAALLIPVVMYFRRLRSLP
jgi:hypothetical protein